MQKLCVVFYVMLRDYPSLIFNYFYNAMAFSLDFRIKATLCHLSLTPKRVNFHIYSNIWPSCKIGTKWVWV